MKNRDESITDKEIDGGLRRLAQVAPGESVWADIEKELSPQPFLPQNQFTGRLLGNRYMAFGVGFAAVLALGVALGIYVSGYFPGNSAKQWLSISQQPASQQPISQRPILKGSELAWSTLVAELPAQLPSQVDKNVLARQDAPRQAADKSVTTTTTRGKFVRHLYVGDEALWDAMLEEEIHLVDEAILHSSPARQRQLWTYRKNLIKQLTTLRYQQVPDKYLF